MVLKWWAKIILSSTKVTGKVWVGSGCKYFEKIPLTPFKNPSLMHFGHKTILLGLCLYFHILRNQKLHILIYMLNWAATPFQYRPVRAQDEGKNLQKARPSSTSICPVFNAELLCCGHMLWKLASPRNVEVYRLHRFGHWAQIGVDIPITPAKNEI